MAEVGSGEPDFEQGSGYRSGRHGLGCGNVSAQVSLDEVLYGVPGVDAEVVGLAQRPSDCTASVQVVQAKDLAHVMEVVGMELAQVGKPDGCHRIQGFEGELFGSGLAAALVVDEFALVFGIDDLLVAVVAAGVGGHQLALMIKVQLVVVAVEDDLFLGADRRNTVAVGFAVNPAAVGDSHGGDLPGVAVVGIERQQRRLLHREHIPGPGVELPVLADIGRVFEPLAAVCVEACQRRIGRQCVQIPPVEKVAFHISDAVFHPSFFVWPIRRTGDRAGAKVAAKVLEAGIEVRSAPDPV